jgi:hypothetical protein
MRDKYLAPLRGEDHLHRLAARVVDNEMRLALQAEGYTVLEAEDGEGAIWENG